jgi:hypothetical protein
MAAAAVRHRWPSAAPPSTPTHTLPGARPSSSGAGCTAAVSPLHRSAPPPAARAVGGPTGAGCCRRDCRRCGRRAVATATTPACPFPGARPSSSTPRVPPPCRHSTGARPRRQLRRSSSPLRSAGSSTASYPHGPLPGAPATGPVTAHRRRRLLPQRPALFASSTSSPAAQQHTPIQREGGEEGRGPGGFRLRPPGLASQCQAKGPYRSLEPTPTTRRASARSPASLDLARANDMEPRAWKPPGLTAPKNG